MSIIQQALMATGGGSGVVAITSFSVLESNITPTDSYAGIRFNADGTIDSQENTVNGFNHIAVASWYTPTGGTPGTGYWIRATLTGGTNPIVGTLSTWLQLSSTRTWQNTITGIDYLQAIMTIEIATDSGGSNIVATATNYAIEAQVEV